MMPVVEEEVFGSIGRYALVENAYAKLRYCYKAILGVGVQQILYELTGLETSRYTVEREK